jgi:hypothetical protein
MRLAIGGPTRDMIPATFAVRLARLFTYTQYCGFSMTEADLFIEHTYIHCGRELVLEAALKQGATHLLWLDTDMKFPRTTAAQLLLHDKPIVGCNYRTRRQSDGRQTAQRDDGTVVPTTATSSGLEAVDAIGFGVVLMRTDVALDVPRPWFRHGLNAQGGDIGEDIMFCRALRAAGHTIYIDHDLSKEVKHIGQYEYDTVECEAVTV